MQPVSRSRRYAVAAVAAVKETYGATDMRVAQMTISTAAPAAPSRTRGRRRARCAPTVEWSHGRVAVPLALALAAAACGSSATSKTPGTGGQSSGVAGANVG